MPWIAPASEAAVSKESAKPEAGPSSATNSKGTFCATVIMTCCNLAFGPRLTSQTLLPGARRAKSAASNNACPAQGSSTAGSIISFFNEGPAGPVTGSKVCSGSGTMLPHTTI